MMSPEQILQALKEKKIKIGVVNDNLKVVDEEKNLDAELIALLKAHKQSLIAYLKGQGEFTLSDFPLANTEPAELAKWLKDYPNISKLYLATPLQKGMLYEEQISDNKNEYVMQYVSRLAGALDYTLLKQAWQKVVERYDILRTAFVGFAGTDIHQLVVSSVALPWQEWDYSHLSGEALTQALHTFAQEDKAQSFDFSQPPLMRINVIRLPEQGTQLVWTYHHTLIDGWSIQLVLNEVLQLYQGLSTQSQTNLPDVSQFETYMQWLHSQNTDAAKTYWQTYLSGLNTPTQVLSADTKTDSGVGEVSFRLEKTTTAQLHQLARQSSTTFFTTVQLAWAHLLSLYSNQQDVVYGTTVSGRPPAINGIENMVGLFINTLPVRVQLSLEQSLSDALKTLHNSNSEKDEFSYFSLENIKANSALSAKQTLFDSVLIYYNLHQSQAGAQASQAQSTELTASSRIEQTYNFPITVKGFNVEDCLAVQVEFHKEAYSEREMQGLAKVFELLLVGYAKLDEKADLQQVSAWVLNQVAASIPLQASSDALNTTEVLAAFENHAQQQPNATALIYDDEKISYQQLNQQANQMAAFLLEENVQVGSVVAVSLEKSPQLLTALLAIAKTGASFLLIDWNLPEKKVREMLRASGAQCVLTQASVVDYLPDNPLPMLELDARKVAKRLSKFNADAFVSASLPENACAYVSVVHQSDGNMAVIPTERWALSKALQYSANVYAQGAHVQTEKANIISRILCASPLNSSLIVYEMFMPLMQGGTCLLVNDIYEMLLLDTPPSLVNMTLSQYRELLNRDFKFSGIKAIHFHGSAPKAGDLNALRKIPDIQAYFVRYLPQTALFYAMLPLDSDTLPPRYLGQLVDANASCLVMDKQNQIQGLGCVGELCLHSDLITKSKTQAQSWVSVTNADGKSLTFFKTGNVAYRTYDGQVVMLGRNDRVVDFNGQRVALTEIENPLKSIDNVVEAAVIVRNDITKDEHLVAYLETKHFVGYIDDYSDNNDYYLAMEECKATLKEELLPELVPDFYVFLEALPRLSDGRIDYAKLPNPETYKKETREYVAPANDIEQQVLAYWEDVFHIRDISTDNNFFELGGTSLQQTGLQAKINNGFDLELSVDQIFDIPTILGMAATISQALAAKQNA